MNFSPDSSQCKAIMFNSSIQLSMAIANGYIPINAILFPHILILPPQILPPSHPNLVALQHSLSQQNKSFIQHGAVGFCGRYWENLPTPEEKLHQDRKLHTILLTLVFRCNSWPWLE